MTRASRRNLILALLLLAMLALAWQTKRQADNVRPPLAELSFAAVEAMRIELRGEPARVFERTADGWRMREPLDIAVDERRLEGIVEGLNTISHADYPADRIDPAELGLGDAPRARVTVDGVAFAFGGTHPVSNLRYVQRGDTVHLVRDIVYFRLVGEPADWAPEQD